MLLSPSQACAFTQSKFVGGFHRPVNQHHAKLDLVGMHQGRAGDGIAPGFQHWHHLQQVLDGRPCAGEPLEHIRMMSEVMCHVTIQGSSLRAVLNNALQLLLFTPHPWQRAPKSGRTCGWAFQRCPRHERKAVAHSTQWGHQLRAPSKGRTLRFCAGSKPIIWQNSKTLSTGLRGQIARLSPVL